MATILDWGILDNAVFFLSFFFNYHTSHLQYYFFNQLYRVKSETRLKIPPLG